MNNDVFDYHIYIEQFSSLLIWLMLVCFLGLCITGFAMIVISRFFLTKTGSRFSIIDFELPFSFTKFKGIVDNTTDNTKETIRMSLKMDYYFMLFAYSFLFFAGWYVLQQQPLMQGSNIYKFLWMPFAAWFFDVLENTTASACLEKLTKTNARLLFIFSLIKWLLIVVYVVVMILIYAGLL